MKTPRLNTLKKTTRAPRKSTYLTYAACIKNGHFTSVATIKNISASGALFTSTDEYANGSIVVACPVEDISKGLPTPEDVLEHPDHIEGTIVRKEGFDHYAIQFGKSLEQSEHFGQRDYGLFSVEQKGILVICELSGAPDLKKFVKFLDLVKQKIPTSLRMLLDFSVTDKIPQIGPVMIRDVIEYMAKEKREIAIVNCEKICPQSTGQMAFVPSVHLFSSREEAESYFEENQYSVLIVEDDEVTLQFTSKFLETQNFQILEATSAEEGIEIAQQENPDLIVMDIRLPGMNGIQAVEQLRNLPETSITPIIMLTGESSRESVEACIQYNIEDYILKPCDPDILFQKVVLTLIKSKKTHSSAKANVSASSPI